MKKQILLFDLDGTIIDSQEGIVNSVLFTLKQYGISEKPENLNCYIGPPIGDALERYHHFDKKDIPEAIHIYRAHYKENSMSGNDLFDGVLPMLDEFLKRGKTLAIATSKPIEVAMPILNDLGIIDRFSFIGGSSLSGERPHKIDVIRHVLSELKVSDLSQVVMIGDRHYDIEGAKLAGIDSIGVLYGYGEEEELRNAGADALAPLAIDLLNIIK